MSRKAEPGRQDAGRLPPLKGAMAPRGPGRPGLPRGRRPIGRPFVEEPAPYVHRLARTKRKPTSDTATMRLVEVVSFFLFDLGRFVDLRKVAALIPAHADMGIIKRRDTPASLTLPKCLVLQLGDSDCGDSGFDCFSSQAKIYEEGAATILVRVKARIPFGQLHRLAERRIQQGEQELTIEGYAIEAARRLFATIAPAITEPNSLATMDRETYTAFCLLDCPEDPSVFLDRNRDYAAALLIGESSGSELHPSQIQATLGKPYSYHRGDLAVFDMDRCLIIDPAGDFEDLLLIIEHANYQLLELRVLDKLLDTWLDEAEDDVRYLYSAGSKTKRRRGSAAKIKFANIQALRFESLFILENLENSSKIIGDYYLGQIYDRLCSIFNTEGWKWSVERRLDALQDVYDMVKTDSGEQRMHSLEITFIVVCIIFPLLQIIQAYVLSQETSPASPQTAGLPPVSAPAPAQASPPPQLRAAPQSPPSSSLPSSGNP